jgi:hypothetical protein
MTMDAVAVAQFLMGLLLAIIGLMVRQVLTRLDSIEQDNRRFLSRLIVLETKCGINHEPPG